MPKSLKDTLIQKNRKDLISEWSDKNTEPIGEVKTWTKDKHIWICKNNHEYESIPSNRLKGTGCPYCSGRKFASDISSVQARFPELTKYWSNQNQTAPDQAWSKNKHYWNCTKYPDREWYSKPSKTMSCPYCSGRKVLKGFNDFETLRPKFAQQWSPNNKTKSDEYTSKSHFNAKWVCSKGHKWNATIGSRVQYNYGCPYCTGQRIITGVNDFATLNPEIMKQWDTVKNKNTPEPSTIKNNSSVKVWWNCPKGHSWKASYASRSLGRNCRICTGKEIQNGINDLKSQKPELSQSLLKANPQTIFKYSTKIFKWLCNNCNTEFEDSPHSLGTIALCSICRKRTSAIEEEFYIFLQKRFPKVSIERNVRSQLNSQLEIDFWLPSKRIGIEFNGDYWHSTQIFKANGHSDSKTRHQLKREIAEKENIELAFVWESDWLNNHDEIEKALIFLLEENTITPILQKLEGLFK